LRGVTKLGTSSVTLGGNNTFGGPLVVSGGEVRLSDSAAAIAGAESVSVEASAKLVLEDGMIVTNTLSVATPSAFEFLGGRLSAINVIGDIENNGGTFAPGASPALTIVNGSYSQFSGVLEIELGGEEAGSEFDRLEIDGSASLGGVLQVVLVDDFEPQPGQTFEFLTADGGVSEAFVDIALPVLSTGMWQTVFGSTSAALLVTIEGDYNGNGIVDAADYTVWRDLLGNDVVAGTSADGDFDGQVTADDYDIWLAHFGETVAGAGASAANAGSVPEPAAMILAIGGILAIAATRRPTRRLPFGLVPLR